MGGADSFDTQSIRQLVLIFGAWKSFLLSLAAFCPGPGYDTSALILLDPSIHRHQNFHSLSRYERLILNLFRWDAFYFVQAAQRDQVFEQEWAFSWAYSKLLRLVVRGLSGDINPPFKYYVVAGIVLSQAFHFISVLILYHLIITIPNIRHQQRIAFVASVLHILTPASLFYSAPYAEALFSLLNFTGMVYYVQSKAIAKANGSPIREDTYKLISGFVFAFATLIRSNGLLNGLIFLYDIVAHMQQITSSQLSVRESRRIIVTCIAGSFIAAGFIWPQYLAYLDFCVRDNSSDLRPWCERGIPSVYSWVQSQYWNVGIFRYWTLPNLPLFLLAAPMLWTLFESSVTFLRNCIQWPLHGRHVSQPKDAAGLNHVSFGAHKLPELVLPQLMLAAAALTSFHVQIVNRIASAYPIWYVTVASYLLDEQTIFSAEKSSLRNAWVIRGMVMYAIIQGVLFANFLPPA